MKIGRLVLYVCALPLLATAVASAHHWIGSNDITAPLTMQLEREAQAEGAFTEHRAHVLAADTAGNLKGRIVQFENEAKDLKVFFVRNGEIEQSTTTDSEGNFTVTGLTAGSYSFVAAGANGFVAHGVYVTTDAVASDEQTVALQTAAVAPSFEAVTTFIQDRQDIVSTVPAEASVAELAVANIGGSNRVQINQDGTVNGRVVALQQRSDTEFKFVDTSAKLIDSNQVEREVAIAEDGTFVIDSVEPGVYDFVAAGGEGFAAISFEAVELTAPSSPASNASFSGTQDFGYDCCPALDVCMTAPIDCGIVYEQIDYAIDCCENTIVEDAPINQEEAFVSDVPIGDIGCGCAAGCNVGCGGSDDFSGCGGGCGGGGGGGFGGGGLGNFGGIIGAALGAYVLTEVLDRIDDGVSRQPVVVPPVIVPPVVSPAS